MESLTKRTLDIDSIRLLVENAFGEETKIGEIAELKDGWFCTAFSIQLLNKDFDVVLKVAPPPDVEVLTYERGINKVDVEVNHILSKHTKVPVPKVLHFNFKHDLINRDYFFMEKFCGTPLNKVQNLTQSDKDKIMFECGHYTAQINSIEGNHFGYFADKTISSNTSWRDTFLNMVNLMLEDGKALGAKYFMNPDEIMDIFRSKSTVLDEITQPRLVHWDIWAANIFVNKKNGSYYVEGIIDFERALWGDSLMEVTFMNIKNEPSFLKGYEQESGMPFDYTNEKKCRRIMYNNYLNLHMVTENYSRKYTGGKSKELMQWADFQFKEGINKLKDWRL